jgi:hypothetical protein
MELGEVEGRRPMKLESGLAGLAIPFALLACGCSSEDDIPPEDWPSPIIYPEGGNIFLEHLTLDSELQQLQGLPAGVTTISRVMAYFMNSQTPELNPLPEVGVCNNLVARKAWPLYVGTPHEDLDVGALTITGKNAANADVAIPVPKLGGGTDAFARPHDIYYQIINPNAAETLKPDSSYTVSFSGSGVVAPTNLPDALFLAESFPVASPALEDNGPLRAGVDFPVHWTPVESSSLPPGAEVIGVTWLLDPGGSPTHLCPVPHGNGQFTITGATIAEYQAIAQARGANPSKAILARTAMVLRLEQLPNGDPENKRRIDMVGVIGSWQLMDVQ